MAMLNYQSVFPTDSSLHLLIKCHRPLIRRAMTASGSGPQGWVQLGSPVIFMVMERITDNSEL